MLIGSNVLGTSLLLAGSILLFGWTVWSLYRVPEGASADLAFANLVLCGLLIGYQASPHDLSLLMLPLALLVSHRANSRHRPWPLHGALLALLLVVYLPPLHLFLLRRKEYVWMAVPMGLLLVLSMAKTMTYRST
jgi:hypothetical protein